MSLYDFSEPFVDKKYVRLRYLQFQFRYNKNLGYEKNK